MSIELCYLSATEAIHRFQNRTLSPVELMQAIISRAEAVEPKVNAFSYTYFDEALKAAKVAESAYVKGTARPLEGIPFAVKDESYIAGLPTSNGSLLMKDFVADETSFVIQRILDAGAIVHAYTTTPELSIAVMTWSKLWGVTRNPWNLAITPGGSTGGGAAALAAGTTTLINGSDIAGSIRVPASMCGLVGYKPPYGRNPVDPPWNLEYYNHPGPLARNLSDCILLQNIISGPHLHDMASLKPKLTLPTTYKDIKGWRIAYSYDLGYQPVAPEIRRLMSDALELFQAAGATTEEVELGWTDETLKATLDHLGYTMTGSEVIEAYKEGKEHITSYVRWMAEYAQRVTTQDFVKSEELTGQMSIRLSQIFETYDLFICPVVACPDVPADFDYSEQTLEIEGESVNPKLGWVMTYPFNMLSRCPVLTIPVGRAENNVPVGLQLVGAPYADLQVFQAAAAYEQSFADMPQDSPFCSAMNYPELA